jgi:hypothetical protein
MRDRNCRRRLVGFLRFPRLAWKDVRATRTPEAGSAKLDPRLTVSIKPAGSGVEVSGSADLPDGTRVRCGAWQGGPEGPFEDVSYRDTSITAGRFAVRFDARPPWLGVVSASVELRADTTQPAFVRAAIGDAGERLLYADLAGPGYRQVFAVVSLDVG